MSQESKLLSYVLRHRPDEAGLTLDPGGWVRLDDLVHKDGGQFWQADNGVWLADHVPSRYLEWLPS